MDQVLTVHNEPTIEQYGLYYDGYDYKENFFLLTNMKFEYYLFGLQNLQLFGGKNGNIKRR